MVDYTLNFIVYSYNFNSNTIDKMKDIKASITKQLIVVITPLILLSILVILLLKGCDKKIIEAKNIVVDGVIVKEPTNKCRAHFSGLLMTDKFLSGWYTEIYQIDESSEYVGEGEYPRAINAFPKAHEATFDGIAIDHGTRVIIYSEENFEGDVLMDETGPVIITNKVRIENDDTKSEVIYNNKKIFKEPLNSNYPPSCRKMSKSNMFEWSKGSLKVICNE